jgi:2-keto-4-pentenoate hydratase/2-oxohepta-3-ene-1,7-dioic acid hydratase in catechol pathway
MQLVTYQTPEGARRTGIVRGDQVFQTAWADPMAALIARGVMPEPTSIHHPLDQVRLLPPVVPGKVLCIGRNYADHAAELAHTLPEKPLVFAKVPSSLIGHGATIRWRPTLTTQVDWEGELAIVIGRRAHRVREADALGHVFGYTIANDVTARDLQNTEGQWTRAKGLDTFLPLGPAIVTRDEVPDPGALELRTEVNGEQMQAASTGQMVFGVAYLIAYLSDSFTLEPGDVILTGTPAGVGAGMSPPRFLGNGDTVSVTIEGIGTLTNPCQIED